MSGEKDTAYSVEWSDAGERLVRWQVGDPSNPKEIQHNFPDAITHHYVPGGLNEDVLLYCGEFNYPNDGWPFYGDVRFRWWPSRHVAVRGKRWSRPSDSPYSMTDANAAGVSQSWTAPSHIDVELDGGALPAQPCQEATLDARPGELLFAIADRLEQEVGDPEILERVTFVVPNGWEALDGRGVCDPDNLRQWWRGRMETTGAGWSVTLDCDSAMTPAAWGELRDMGGFRFTHVGQLVRTDGTSFTGEQAFEVLHRVQLGMSLALGRRASCVLPVGWRQGHPVWARWRSPRVDPYVPVSHWLDKSISSKQLADIVSLVLEFTADGVQLEVLRHALAYYVAARVDVDVEPSVGLPVSALQLLAYYRFVTCGTYSRSKWEDSKQMPTEEQIRLLLEDCSVDLQMPLHFAHLAGAQSRLAQSGATRDALRVVIKMRNVVTHPTRNQRSDFTIYEWAEAGMLVQYWLCMALLNTVGYQGQIADRSGGAPHQTGQLTSVPWT